MATKFSANPDWGENADFDARTPGRSDQQTAPPPTRGVPRGGGGNRGSRGGARPPSGRPQPRETAPPSRAPSTSKPKLVESAPVDDQIWSLDGVSSSLPRTQLYSANVDLSTFPLLIDETYNVLVAKDNRVRRQMPYCSYQHVMGEYLNGYLIEQAIDNGRSDFDGEARPTEFIPDDHVVMPEAIANFIESIANTVTPSGDEVRVNLPTVGIPQLAIPAQGEATALPSGSFGPADVDHHNAYECYLSPLVTSGLVKETVKANSPNPPGEKWQPLTGGNYPDGSTPNRNLLGWRVPERLTQEALNTIDGINFAGTGMQGRLCHSSELLLRVTSVLREKDGDIKMRYGWPKARTKAPDLSFVLVNECPPGQFLADSAITVRSPFALSAPQVSRVTLLGQRRRRGERAAGCCYTIGNADVPGWVQTRNNNFRMEPQAGFGPIGTITREGLREWLHSATAPNEPRSQIIVTWLRAKHLVS